MKIYLIDKQSNKNSDKLVNLGGKITLEKLHKFLDEKNTILVRNSDGRTQTDFRIHKVPETKKRDRGYRIIKAFYVVNMEMGEEGFEDFVPKKVIHEQNLRFRGLDRLLNMLEAKQNLLRADWIIG
jgi:hypothetical protein